MMLYTRGLSVLVKEYLYAKLTIIKGNHLIANKCHAEFNQSVGDFLKTI